MAATFITYLWIAAGSALGGAGRYFLSTLIARNFGETFPIGTITVNVVGSMIIGLVATLSDPGGRLLLSGDLRLAIMIGVLGGFTTFSSFSLQTLNLLRDGQAFLACVNILGSVLLCLVGVWLGHAAGIVLNR